MNNNTTRPRFRDMEDGQGFQVSATAERHATVAGPRHDGLHGWSQRTEQHTAKHKKSAAVENESHVVKSSGGMENGAHARTETFSPAVSFQNLFEYVHQGSGRIQSWSEGSSSGISENQINADQCLESANNSNVLITMNEWDRGGLTPMHTSYSSTEQNEQRRTTSNIVEKNEEVLYNTHDISTYGFTESVHMVPDGHVHVKVVHHNPVASQRHGNTYESVREQGFFSNDFNRIVRKSVDEIVCMKEGCCSQSCTYRRQRKNDSPSKCCWIYIRHNYQTMNAANMSSHDTKLSYGWGMVPFVLQSGCAPGEVQDGWMSSSGTNSSQKSDNVSILSENEIELTCLLGRGSFGQVYKGRVAGVDRAVKSIQIEEKELEKVIREAEMGCYLIHPNVVRTFMYRVSDGKRHCLESIMKKISLSHTSASVSESSGTSNATGPSIGIERMFQPNDRSEIEDPILQVYIIQELCDVGAMSSYIECDDFFTTHMTEPSMTLLDCIVLTTLDVINSLIYLGHNGIIHGDLSSNNVMFTTDTTSPLGLRAKVIDFGRSRVEKSTNHITNTLGTISHMPPEMLLTGELNKTADMYAVGILVLEMWTKTHAWHGRHAVQILFAMSSGRRVKVPDDIPPPLRSFIIQCLDDDPHKRPVPEEAFETLKAMIHPRLVMRHLISTSVASRLT
jgi:serine/threonine protein kinase